MSVGSNHLELKLLKEEPHQLILAYQGLIDIIIKQFIRNNCFGYYEFEEVKQRVNEELLNKLPKIQSQYSGKSLLKTYFSVVIRNICNGLIRKREDNQFVPLNDVDIGKSDDDVINTILFQEEINKLKFAINLYYCQKEKLLLCLKLKYRMPFDFKDFKGAFRQITMKDFELFKQKIHPYNENPDIVLLSVLTDIFNKLESKNNTPDALRKWLKQKINELIDVLNGSPPTSKYNEETLQILFEKAFYNETEIKQKVY